MICPHCNVAFHAKMQEFPLFATDEDLPERFGWSVSAQICPECNELEIHLLKGIPTFEYDEYTGVNLEKEYDENTIWPMSTARVCPTEVPEDLKSDFLEAAAVLAISPKASAALSRRCLQHLLREHSKVKRADLSHEIAELLNRHILPTDLEEQLDAVRNIGNFAAHPQKDKMSGEILPVEPHEAEWNLDVLEELFDHYFVRPERMRLKKEELNSKLLAAGKPLLK